LQTAGLAFSPNIYANSQKFKKISSLREEAVHISTDLLTKIVDNPPIPLLLALDVLKPRIEIIQPPVPPLPRRLALAFILAAENGHNDPWL